MSGGSGSAADLRLERSASTTALIDELSDSLPRVALDGVLAGLDRDAEACAVPSTAAVEGFRWDRDDRGTRWWYPQGITTSADATEAGDVGGRRVLVTSWYAKTRRGRNKGARLTFVDLSDPSRPRYRHVLLVEPFRDEATGGVDIRPVVVHAGGICWYGGYLYVAATGRGIRVFAVDDLIAVPARRDDDLVGRQGDGGYAAFGYAFMLPQSFRYDAWSNEGVQRLRYSFLSLDRTGEAHHLVAGEYGTGDATTRLARFGIDRRSHLLGVGEDGHARPLELLTDRVQRMQGAALVHGRYAITTSRGRTTHGDLLTGSPGALTRHRGVLAVGPEDITYCPARQRLWTLSEWPHRRWVYAVDARRFLPDLA